jgi:hypothetical protein
MSDFPNFTQVPPHVNARISERIGNPKKVSSLNSWIRVSSANGTGLMLYSNPNISTFKKAGDNNMASIYGNGKVSGILGTDWSGGAVYANEGQGFKPSPIISSIEVDEGAGDLSRKASFSITAFTKEQMEKLLEYFLEPGYTVFLEWGWNTANSVSGWESSLSGPSVAKFQSFKEVNKRRAATGGEYDNYLGFITGGGLSQDGDKWTISVQLTGFTELPGYMMSTENAEDEITIDGKSDPKIDPADPFGANLIENAGKAGELGKERFMRMFNALPDSRKTPRVQELITTLSNIENFINWDEDVSEQINGETEGGFWSGKSKKDVGGTEVELPKGTQLISENKFIKFGAMMDIVFAIGCNGFKLSNGKTVNFRVNTSSTYCMAFDHMYSLDPTILYIPNPNTPKFKVGKDKVGLDVTDVSDNSKGLNGIQFPNQDPLEVTTKGGAIIKQAGKFYGKLDDLYVNFDFVKGILETKNNTTKDALYQILNGMSSAVNGLWDFQIVEKESELHEGVTELTVIDLNFVSSAPGAINLTMNTQGEKSIIIDSSLDLGISAAKMDSIIGQRLSTSLNGNGKAVPSTLFSGNEDMVLNQMDKKTDAQKQLTAAEKDKADAKKQEALDVLLGKLFLYPLVTFKEASEVKDKDLYDICYIGAYKDVETFAKIKKKELGDIVGSGALMPIKFSFKIHGISGIKRGDMFRVNGLPSMYERPGSFFQTLSVKHVIDGMQWTTEITGGFRPKN